MQWVFMVLLMSHQTSAGLFLYSLFRTRVNLSTIYEFRGRELSLGYVRIRSVTLGGPTKILKNIRKRARERHDSQNRGLHEAVFRRTWIREGPGGSTMEFGKGESGVASPVRD